MLAYIFGESRILVFVPEKNTICLLKITSEELLSTVNRNLEIEIEKSAFLQKVNGHFEQVSYTGIESSDEISTDIISMVRKRRPFSPVIILTDTVDVPTAIKWMKLGIDDVLDISRFSELEKSIRKGLEVYEIKLEERSTNHYLNLLADHLDEIIFEFDYLPQHAKKWKLNYCSKSLENVLGYKVSTWIANPQIWSENIHPEDLQQVKDTTRKAYRMQRREYRKYRIRSAKTQEYVWLEDHISPILNDRNEVVQFVGVARDIHSQIKASAELETKRTLLSEAESLVNMGSWKFDVVKNKVEVSDSLKSMLGVPDESLFNNPNFMVEYVPVNVRSEVEEFLNVVHLNGQTKVHEHNLLSKTGDTRFVQTTLRGLRNDNGELKGVIGTTRDITTQKKQESEIERSKKFIESIIDTSPSIIYVIDYRTKLMEHGMKRFAEYFGYTSGEIEVMPNGVDDLVHPDDLASIESQEKKLAEAADGSVVPIEFRVQHRDGHWVWVMVHSKIFERDSDGTPIKAIGTVVDINKRKESDKKFEAVAENAIAGIFIMQNDRVIYANPAISEITGYSIDELSDIHFLEFLHPSIRQEAAKFPMKLLQRKSKNFHNEQIIVRKDKTERYAEITTSMINFEGNPAMLGVVFDISDRKKSEIDRNKLIDRLTIQNKNLEDFSYIISHKLRSPVASIMGLIDLLDENGLSAQNLELLEHLTSSTQNLDAVIQDLSKTMNIKKTSDEQWEEVDLGNVVKSVRQALSDRIENNKAMIGVDIADLENLYSIRSYLQNILFNLLSNALKFRDPERHPIIKIVSGQIGDQIELLVKDNGLGIDLETNKDRIFKLYERFHPEINGRGIGLHLVKTQVESLGGSIHVESEVGKGSTFKILMPLLKKG